MNLDDLRQTGRTTRMLERAINASKDHKVIILADSWRSANMMMNTIVGMGASIARPHEVSMGWHAIEFCIPGKNFDWKNIRSPLHGEVLLVDHHAIETRFASLLDMLHAFDLDCKPGKPQTLASRWDEI